MPLEWAPTLYTGFSFAVLLIPFAIILFGHSTVWDSGWRRLAACGIVLFCPAALGEVWLNVINAQIYLGLASLCILLEDLRSASTRRRSTGSTTRPRGRRRLPSSRRTETTSR